MTGGGDGEVFHMFDPAGVTTAAASMPWVRQYSFNATDGPACCHRLSATFHYMDPAAMRDAHCLLHACRA